MAAFSRQTDLWKALVFLAASGLASPASAQVQQVWSVRHPLPPDGEDVARAVGIDGSGAVYAAGDSFNGANQDIVTVRYGSSSNLAWERRYNGSGNGDDIPVAMAVDSSGNAVVTGQTWNGSNWDYVTLKYNSSGLLLWSRVYDGPDGKNDQALALAVDASGNVAVTGRSENASSVPEYATIKYSSGGGTFWTARYNDGSSGFENSANEVAFDSGGNVVVSGRSSNGSNFDYATLKYASGSGTPVWAAAVRYDAGGDDLPEGLAIDGSGNVVITGSSVGGGTGQDFLTVKYDAAGVYAWEQRYNEASTNGADFATAIGVDASGNVAVTGASDGGASGLDYLTLKYAPAGTQTWVKRYNGPAAASVDQARALAVDASGRIVVTGVSSGTGTNDDSATIRYDAAGNQGLLRRYNGPAGLHDAAAAVAVNSGGDIAVAGRSRNATNDDFVTLRYPVSGSEWNQRYYGMIGDGDYAADVAVDSADNVIVTGRSPDPAAGYQPNTKIEDYLTVKLAPDGTKLWERRYNGPSNLNDRPAAVAVDADDNIVVTGQTGNTDGGNSNQSQINYATVKYDPDGNQLWATLYNGPGTDEAVDLVIDAAGNVIVTGYSYNQLNPPAAPDFLTVKYNAAGVQQWERRYNGPNFAPGSYDLAQAVGLDSAGNILVTGYSTAPAGSTEFLTLKYAPNGDLIWERRYDGPAHKDSRAVAMAIDFADGVIVAGSSYNGSNFDYATIKYDAAGVVQWDRSYTGPGNNYDDALAVATDPTGKVAVTGGSFGAGSAGYDYLTILYDADGNAIWTKRFAPGNGHDAAQDVRFDSAGHVMVTGYASHPNETDYGTIRYAADNGDILWQAFYTLPYFGHDYAMAMALDSAGDIIVTGHSQRDSFNQDFATVKFRNVNVAPAASGEGYDAVEDTQFTVPAPGVLANDTDANRDSITAALVSGPAHGQLTLDPDGSFSYDPDPDFHGPDSFTYSARDAALDSNVVTVSLDVAPVNDAPLASGDSYSLDEDATLDVAAPGPLGNDSDVDLDSLGAVLVSGPAHGQLTLDPDGSFSYDPDPDFHGPDSFTYNARDAALDSNVVTVSLDVAPLNDAPLATGDSYSLDEDVTLGVKAPGVLGNDSDVDLDSLSVVLVSGPAHGQLTLDPDGSFSYDPDPDFHGPDSFTYNARDAALDSNVVTVSLDVAPVNDAPLATGDSYSLDEDDPLDVAAPGPLGNDSDVEMDPLGAVLVSGPAHGQLTLGPDGSFSYVPDPDFNGPDSFTYNARDAKLDSNVVTVSLDVAPLNDAPLASGDSYSLDEDDPLDVAAPGPLGNDSDVDLDPLGAVLVSGPAHGQLTLGPDGSFSYVPDPDFNGPDSFTYNARDAALDSEVVSVSLDVASVNDQPLAASDSYSLDEDVTLNVAAPGLLGNDSDVEMDPLGAVLVSGPAHGQVALAPDGSFSYVPDPDFDGPDSFTYRARDASLDSAAVSVSLDVAPDAFGPDISIAKTDGTPSSRLREQSTYTLRITNVGEGTATGVVVSDSLPVGLTFLSASDGGTLAGGVVSWPAFSLDPGAAATRSLLVQVNASALGNPDLVNTATAVFDSVDSVPGNNSAADQNLLRGMCSRSSGCFVWELMSVDFESRPGEAGFTWMLTNHCASPLRQADFRSVPGAQVTDLLDGDSYASPLPFTGSGPRSYAVDVIGGPHAGVRFEHDEPGGIASGESEAFTFHVDAAELSAATVLWHNASTAAGDLGRIDMRTGLCFSPPDASAVQVAAQPAGAGWIAVLGFLVSAGLLFRRAGRSGARLGSAR